MDAKAPEAADTAILPIAETVCAVAAHDWVNDEYKHLVLEAPDSALAARAGQFFHLLCPTVGDDAPFLRRPMSVYRVDRPNAWIEFLYKVTGAGTRTLAGLVPGDELDVFGPLGNGFTIDEGRRHLVMVARGVGLSTLAPLAELAAGRGLRTTAILSARAPALLMSEDYLRSAGADVVTVTDAEANSGVDQVEAMVRRLIDDGADMLATCGSNRLLQMLRRIGSERGVAGQVAMEQTMGCGIGMCFCCVRPFRVGDELTYRRVCYDGPVFDLQESVSW
jgi:dihydroorotate dehydrogenase electron transfer subunit